MTTVAYPANLPPPVREGFLYKYANGLKRLPMDDGGLRPVNDWQAQPRSMNLTFVLSWDEFAVFEAWWEYDANSGANDAVIPTMDGGADTVEFTGDPKIAFNKNTGTWQVTIACQTILQKPVISAEPDELPLWPDTLPEGEQDDYTYVTNGAIHTNVSEGAQESRTRFKYKRSDITIRFILTPEQRSIFDNFVQNTLIGSLGWFRMPIASGVGSNVVKVAFAEVVVEPLGAAYQVNAKINTHELPRMSEIQYRYPNGVTINEVLYVKETYSKQFKGDITITEELWLAERFARTLVIADRLLLVESVSKRLGRNLPTETLTFLETVKKSFRLGKIQEALQLSEIFLKQAHKILSEHISLSETLDSNIRYNREHQDLLFLYEEISKIAYFDKEPDEYFGFNETVTVYKQDYALDYFSEEYVGETIILLG